MGCFGFDAQSSTLTKEQLLAHRTKKNENGLAYSLLIMIIWYC